MLCLVSPADDVVAPLCVPVLKTAPTRILRDARADGLGTIDLFDDDPPGPFRPRCTHACHHQPVWCFEMASRTRAASVSRSAYSSPAVAMGGSMKMSTGPGTTVSWLPRGISRRVPRQHTGTIGSPVAM